MFEVNDKRKIILKTISD